MTEAVGTDGSASTFIYPETTSDGSMPAREQEQNWAKQGRRELESAERALSADDFYLVAYLCHQSVEKMLKALILHRRQEPPPHTHSLMRLGALVGIPDEHGGKLRELTPHYMLSRYPDASGEPPYELYTRQKTEAMLKDAREVITWIEKQLTQ